PTHALRGVDLELRPGEVHALVGENGAGKSTLMKVLSGALKPDGGHMILDGKPYAPAGPLEARRQGVAMIYQELTLAPHLSVEANVLLGLEQTRAGFLRRGLHLDGRVLVLDEPTSSLTQEDARRLFELIRRLRQRGVTVVYISHFLE